MTVTIHITRTEYIKLVLSLYYRKGKQLFIAVAGLCALPAGIAAADGAIILSGIPSLVYFFLSTLTLVVIPFLIYRQGAKQYDSNTLLHERIECEFTGHTFRLKGPSFSAELDLTKCNRILELKHWFLFYESQTAANVFPKAGMSSTQVGELREILRGLPEHVRKILRK